MTVQPALKRPVLKPSKPPHPCSKARARRKSGGTAWNAFLTVHLCWGLKSTLDEPEGIVCQDGSQTPCSYAAGLINSCSQSLIQALLHGWGVISNVCCICPGVQELHLLCSCCWAQDICRLGVAMLKKQHGLFFFFVCFIFNFSIFLSAFWLPESLRVSVSIQSMVAFSSEASLYHDESKVLKEWHAYVNRVTFLLLPPFPFPTCPCLSGTVVVFAFKGCV